MKSTRVILFRIILVILGIFVGVVFSEIIASAFIKKTKLDLKAKYIEQKKRDKIDPGIGIYDDYLGWALNPKAEERSISSEFNVIYKVNSDGFRDKDVAINKKKTNLE